MEDFNMDVFDMDNLDESLIDDLDLNNFGTVEEEINLPHIKVATKEFKDVLKIAKSVIATSAKDIISKSLCLVREGDKVRAYATDFDVYYEGVMDLLNTENILEEPIVFPVDVMIKLIKAVPANLIIIKDEEGYKLKLAGGDVALEVHSIGVDKFQCQEQFDKEDKSLNSLHLLNIIKDFSPLCFGAVSPQERRIVFNDKALASYMFSGIMAQGDFPNMDLKIKDMNILKQLLPLTDEELEFFNTKDAKVPRKMIQSSKYKFTFLLSNQPANEGIVQGIQDLEFENGVFIDFLQFYKLVELSSELNYSIGKVGLNVDETGSIKLAFKTKKGKDTIFTLDGSINGNVVTLDKELEIQSKLLRVLLKAFTKESSIKVNVLKDALIISSDNYNSVIFASNRA